MKNIKQEIEKIPAIPPNDYEGSVGEWIAELINRGYMKNGDWHGDVMLNADEYWEILEKLEE